MEQSDPRPHAPYASIGRRMQAFVIDWLLVTGSVVLLAFLAGAADGFPLVGATSLGLIFVIVMLYEPVMVAEYGATLGHRWTSIRVVARSGGPPSLLQAFIRYWIKGVFGIISFATLFTSRRQAVHDLLTGTTVQVCDPDILDALAAQAAEAAAEAGEQSPEPAPPVERDPVTGLTPDQSAALSLLEAQMDQLRRTGLITGPVLEMYQRQRAAILRGEVTAADFTD